MLFKQKSRTEKAVVATWLLMPLTMLSIAIYGWVHGDVLGGLLISLLPVSLLASISVLISTIIGGATANKSKWIWVTVSLVALLIALMFANRAPSDAVKGADTVLSYAMLILSFPLGILAPYIFIAIAPLNINGMSNLIIICTAFSIFGYVQWFVILPWLVKKLRRSG